MLAVLATLLAVSAVYTAMRMPTDAPVPAWEAREQRRTGGDVADTGRSFSIDSPAIAATAGTSTTALVFPDTTLFIPDLPSTTIGTSTTTTLLGDCGDPNGDRAFTASDALITLSAAVGATACQPCVCDLDGNGSVSATDALFLLGIAVGQSLLPACAPC